MKYSTTRPFLTLALLVVSILFCRNALATDSFNQLLATHELTKAERTTKINPKTLSRAYGFVIGQEFSLTRIKKEFPELEVEVLKAELEFNLAFGKAKERIASELKATLEDDYGRYEVELKEKMFSTLSSQTITKEVALNFLQVVKARSKGKDIESPIIETLLTYQFIDNPMSEFSTGFIRNYSTGQHPKAKGVNLNAKIPLSWMQIEGERPNIIHKFVSENGSGLEAMLFMVRDLGLPKDYKITQSEVEELFSESGLKQMLPENSKFILGRRITLDNYPGGLAIFEMARQRVDLTLNMRAAHFITIYDGKMIFFQGMVTAIGEEDLEKKFNSYLPLFKQVANSMIFIDQY